MKIPGLIALGLAAATVFGVYGWTRYRSLHSARIPASAPLLASAEPEKHKVTPRMLATAQTREKRPAPPFRKVDAQGQTHSLAELLETGPIVLLFIKDGCPCSVSAEGYFNRMHASYGGHIRFFGVIDGDAAVARRWAEANGVPFPILPDPEHELVHLYGAENSAYVTLIDRDRTIDMFWPGYSAGMLRDLNARMARLAGRPEQPVDVGEAPDELYSGCPFE
jgi:peroxiredoxin